MAAKICHQLFGAFLMLLVLQPFVVTSRPVKLESLQYSHEGDVGVLPKPRCGIPDNATDVTNDHDHDGTLVSEYSFFNGNPKWRTTRLTFGFRSNLVLPAGMNFQVMRGVMQRAFRTWSNAVPQFQFQEIAQRDAANIKIAFVPLMSNTLGVGFSPEDGSLYFNININWNTNAVPARNQMDLESVVLHEIGHGLGLGHSEFPNAVMFPSISYGVNKRVLNQDDITGLRVLYGL